MFSPCSIQAQLVRETAFFIVLLTLYICSSKFISYLTTIKSCYDSAHICPIRGEISTHEHWENVLILYFVWLVVIGFRQNYSHILPKHLLRYWLILARSSTLYFPGAVKTRQKITVHLINLAYSEFPNRSCRCVRSFISTLNCT